MEEKRNKNIPNSHHNSPYENSLEHIADEMKRLDILLHMKVLKHQQSTQPMDPFQGLIISEAEITALFLDHQLADAVFTDSDDVHHNQDLVDMFNQLDTTICQRRNASAAHGIALSLPTLSRLFRLSPFEERCLVICLAPEIGRRYEKVFAFLQDDVTRKKPSIDLVLDLLCATLTEKLAARSSFAPTSPLIYYRLLHITDSPVDNPIPLISRFLKLDDRIVEALIGSNGLDARLSHVSRLIADTDELDPIVESLEGGSRIQKLINAYFRNPESAKSLVFYLYGRYGSGRQALRALLRSRRPERRQASEPVLHRSSGSGHADAASGGSPHASTREPATYHR